MSLIEGQVAQLARELEDAKARNAELAGWVMASDDALMDAWGIIANASEWMLDINEEHKSPWLQAAIRWRDEHVGGASRRVAERLNAQAGEVGDG